MQTFVLPYIRKMSIYVNCSKKSVRIIAGTTPQRKDYVYPRVLSKPRSREELEDEFKAQQEELQSALSQCETVIEVDEDKPLDQVPQNL